MAAASSSSSAGRPRKVWWLVGVIILMICIMVQMPAVWLANQFIPDSPYVRQVSGNVWKGSAVLELGNSTMTNAVALPAAVTWEWRPFSMFLGKLGADIEIVSGKTRLEGTVNKGFKKWQLFDLSGEIDRQTLAKVVNWQLPDAPIQVNGLTLTMAEDAGFSDVDGQLTWVGGELGYPSGGRFFNILLPPMRVEISQETRNDSEVLHANLVDDKSKRLGDFYLDNQGMLDVNLTQRLLEHMPSYKGSAPADTAVVSVRQPLISTNMSRSNMPGPQGLNPSTPDPTPGGN